MVKQESVYLDVRLQLISYEFIKKEFSEAVLTKVSRDTWPMLNAPSSPKWMYKSSKDPGNWRLNET